MKLLSILLVITLLNLEFVTSIQDVDGTIGMSIVLLYACYFTQD